MRVRVPKKRRVEEFAKDFEVGRWWGSLLSDLSERLWARAEAILRIVVERKEKKYKGGDKKFVYSVIIDQRTVKSKTKGRGHAFQRRRTEG